MPSKAMQELYNIRKNITQPILTERQKLDKIRADKQVNLMSTLGDLTGIKPIYEGISGMIDELKKTNTDVRNPGDIIKRTELVKKVLTAPVTALTSGVGVPIGLALKYSGAEKGLANVFNKLPEAIQPYAQAGLEMLGVLGAKAPIKIKKVNIADITEGIKTGSKTTPGIVEGALQKSVKNTIDSVKESVYRPMRAQLETIKTPYFVGKAASNEIRNYITELEKSGKLLPNEAKQFLVIADNAAKYNRIPDLLNFRSAADRTGLQIKAEYGTVGNKGIYGFIDKVQGDIRNIINKNIENGITQSNMPELLPQMKNANQVYSKTLNDLSMIEGALGSKMGKQIGNIIDDGVDSIKSAKRLAGEKAFKEGVYNHIAEQAFNLQGEFEPKAFARAIDKIGVDRGTEIFGKDYPAILEFAKQMGKQGIGERMFSKLPVINKLGLVEVFKLISKMQKQNKINAKEIIQEISLNPAYIQGGGVALTQGITAGTGENK